MGFAGGLVPSPSALVVLVGAIALGRAWFGVLLVVAYGAGMAVTLTGAGLLLVRARAALDRRAARPASAWARSRATRSWSGAILGWSGPGRARLGVAALGRPLPLASASVIVLVGLFLAARGATGL